MLPEMQAKRQNYNEQAMDNTGGMGVDPSFAPNPTINQFKPDGQGPEHLDPKMWAKAEQNYGKDQERQFLAHTQEANKLEQENKGRAQAGLPPIANPYQDLLTPAQTPAMPQMQGQQEGLAPQATSVSAPRPEDAMQDAEGMFRSGYQDTLSGLKGEAKATEAYNTEKTKTLELQAGIKQASIDSYNSSVKHLDDERQGFIQDVKDGHVDPEKYWQNHSKLMAGIGMIVAGFNPTNNPNAAIAFLKNQMDLNIRAQEKNLDSSQNLLRANTAQYGNLRDGMMMTRIQQNDLMSNQLEQAAAKAATPMAQAQLMKAAGHFKLESAPMAQQFAMRRALMSMNNGGPQSEETLDHTINALRVMNPEMAKEMASRRVPGFGMGTVAVPEGIRKEITEKKGLNDAAQDLFAYSKTHTNIVPGTKDYNYGVAKALAFQQKVREGLLGTVFRESEKPLLEKFVNDNPAGAFKTITTQPQLKAIIDSNRLGLHETLQSYGLKPGAGSNVMSGGQDQQQQEPMRGKDGKMYIRKGQFMVPVSK